MVPPLSAQPFHRRPLVKSIPFLPLLLAAALLISLPSVRADESPSWAFLGPIPVQYVNPGEELVLDLHRFYAPETPAAPLFSVAASPAYTARFDPATFQLHVKPTATTPGLLEIPVVAPSGRHQPLRGVITLVIRPLATASFHFKPDADAKQVSVVGDFNDWNLAATPLRGPDAAGLYNADLPLAGGKYGYDFVVDGHWLTDPADPATDKDEKHGEHSVLEFAPEDSAHPPTLYADWQDKALLGVRIVDGASPVSQVSAVYEGPGWDSEGDTVPLSTEILKGVIHVNVSSYATGFVRVVAVDERGHASNVLRFPLGNPTAFRWQDAVMYYAFTDRFADGDAANDKPIENPDVTWPANYHGGDLRGIQQKIDEGYFDKLGVNTVWLAPLNRNPDHAYREFPEPHRWYTGYHGYWPVSPTEIDPHFGNADDLKALVKSAHAHGIKIIADLVLHHVHEDHPWWKEHPDWFGTLMLPDGRRNLRLWDEQQYTTWFEPFLPAFDFSKDAPTQALIDNTVWWANEYDLDGFRLDAVKHIRPRFWYRFREALRARVDAKRDRPLYLVGETFQDRAGIDQFVGPNMLDGQFDFPLYDQVKNVLALGQGDLATLENAERASERVYGKEALMSPLIGNHDKPRFLAYADGDIPAGASPEEENAIGWVRPARVDHPDSYAKLELAQAYLLSLDGVPMLYYGDEVGMTGAGDPDNRRDMEFGGKVPLEGQRIADNFRKLGQLRAAHPALRYGSRRVLQASGNVDAFVRAHLSDRVLAVFNRAKTETSLTLPVAPELADGDYTDALSGHTFKVTDGSLTCTIPAETALFLVKAQP